MRKANCNKHSQKKKYQEYYENSPIKPPTNQIDSKFKKPL